MDKNIVVKVMEERLAEYGFKFEKYETCRWTFKREIKDVRQYVVIQKDIWGGNLYILEIHTSVHGRSLRVRNFVDDAKYTNDYFEFKNEEERIAALNEIADIVIKYGIDELNKRSLPINNYYPTEYMHHELYEKNNIFTQNYLKKCNIQQLSENSILPMLKKDLEECYGKTYEQVQDKLVELSAVYGNLIIDKIGGQWQYNERLKTTSFDCKPIYLNYPVLSLFVSYWKDKNAEQMIKNYLDTISGFQDWVQQWKQAYGEDWEPDKAF